MANTALNRTEVVHLTNKSGGSVTYGGVVIISSGTASSFTTTTTEGYSAGMVGVCVEPNGIANNASGMIAISGYVPRINLDASATLGYFIKHDGVAAQGTPISARATGAFGAALETGTNPAAILWGITDSSSPGIGYTAPTSWTPTVTQSGSVTVTVSYAQYMVIGKMLSFWTRLTVTGSGTGGNDIVFAGLPTAPAETGAFTVGVAYISDGAAVFYEGALRYVGSGNMRIRSHLETNDVGSDPSFALAATDEIELVGNYIIA